MTKGLLDFFIVRKLVINFNVDSVINFDFDFSVLIPHSIWGL